MDIRTSIVQPNTSKEFEHWCKWIARHKYGPDVFLYEKYNQDGIDIYWTSNGKYYVIQAKLRDKLNTPSELIDKLEADFDRARKKFNGNLAHFVFATTMSQTDVVKTINRTTRLESLVDACNRLEKEHNIKVVCWHWNHIQDEIAGSPYLQWHLLKREQSADYICTEFFENEHDKITCTDEELKLDFYAGIDQVQWHGVAKGLDASRDAYMSIKESIAASFQQKYAQPVCAVIRGDGGSGKSVLLRRLAHDLKNDYCIYWLGRHAGKFMENELKYDIQKFPSNRFLVIMEDWYRNIEYSKQLDLGNNLLHEISNNPNVRLLIGDRKGPSKLYDGKVLRNVIFDLLPGENSVLLAKIFEQMPAWKNMLSEKEMSDSRHTALFIILFVFCYGERPGDGGLTDRYHRIFKSDYKLLMNRGESFWKGMARALYVYSSLYAKYGFKITLDGLIMLAEVYADCDLPQRYLVRKSLLNDPILKKYCNVQTVISKTVGEISNIAFNHDTMAEQGWASLAEMEDIYIDDDLIENIDAIFQQNNRDRDVRILKESIFSAGGEMGKQSARKFINSLNPQKYADAFVTAIRILKSEKNTKDVAKKYLTGLHPENIKKVYCACLDVLKKEDEAKDAAKKYLATDHPEDIKEAFCICLEILKREDEGKDAAKKYLATDHPESIFQAFCTCLELLKGEDEAKDAAKKYLATDHPEDIREAFCTCLEMLKGEDEAKDAAKKYLATDHPESIFQAFCTCLEMLKGEDEAKDTAKKYLATDHPQDIAEAFCTCLEMLKGEDEAKDAAKKYLATDHPEDIKEAFCTCLEMLKGDDEAKHIAKKYLATDHPENIREAFCTCLEMLKGEDEAKDAAKKYLATDHPENTYQAFCTCLRILDVDALPTALDILGTYETQKWSFVYNSLAIVSKFEKYNNLVRTIVVAVIANKKKDSTGYNNYKELLKIPLFNIAEWQTEVNYHIGNFKHSNRNFLHSITISHRDCAELLISMCIGILRNWENELIRNRSRDGYFARCLAHPIIVEKRALKKEVTLICEGVLVAYKNKAIYLTPKLRQVIINIVDKGIFPKWNYEEDDK